VQKAQFDILFDTPESSELGLGVQALLGAPKK